MTIFDLEHIAKQGIACKRRKKVVTCFGIALSRPSSLKLLLGVQLLDTICDLVFDFAACASP